MNLDLSMMRAHRKSAVHCDTKEKAEAFFNALLKQYPEKVRNESSAETIIDSAFIHYKASDVAFCPHFENTKRAGFCNIAYYEELGYRVFDFSELCPIEDLGSIDAGDMTIRSLLEMEIVS